MKKVLSILFIAIFVFAMSGCVGKKELTKVNLTSENFEEYFSLSAEVIDFKVDENNNDDVIAKEYVGYANLKIVLNPKKEFKIENVSVSGKTRLYGFCWDEEADQNFEVNIDEDGKLEYTTSVKSDICKIFKPTEPNLSKIYRHEQKENELLVSNDKILITSLGGVIYE